MKRNQVTGGNTLVGSLIAGACVSAGVTLICAAMCAVMISKEILPQRATGYGALVTLFLAALSGALAGAEKAKQKRFVVCLSVMGIYMIILLLITALFFGGRYGGVGETALVLLAAAFVAAMAGQRQKKGRNLRRSKIKHR